jgi:hypothetical protein
MLRSGLNAKARLVAGPFLLISLYFYFIELSETKMPVLANLFFQRKACDLLGFAVLIFLFSG